MSTRTVLPFARGTYQSAPGLEGLIFFDTKYKQHLIVARNTDAAALTAKRVVKWEDREKNQVDYSTASTDGPLMAGVVDPKLSSTVPVNANFYVVAGVCTVSLGTSALVAAAGEVLVPSGDSDKGKLDPYAIGAAGAPSLQLQTIAHQCGVALASANFNSDVEADIQPLIKWW
jgi:hypothetical protein